MSIGSPSRPPSTVPLEHAASSTPGTRMWQPARPLRSTAADPDHGVVDEAGALLGDGASTLRSLAPGMQLPGSRLRILERINDGGCGVVYRGEHIDLRRPVAIKVQRGERLSPGARERFLDEARATTRIDSPHVVQVVDFGELDDGRVWYAMELLDGRSLDELIVEASGCESGRMEVARVVALLRMACKGLGATHAAGLVHRDVKPQNLVVAERNGREHLVLVDFGISVGIGTTPGVVCGTPEYMAREQINGGTLDARTDVYGLACCAYLMLTGRSVVDGCTIPEALAQHGHGLDPAFTCMPAVPLALELLVRRCLAVEASQRIANMVEFEAALCEAQIVARVPNTRDDLELPSVAGPRRERIAAGFARLRKPPARHRARRWASAGVVVGALGVSAIWPRSEAALPAAPTIATAGIVATVVTEGGSPAVPTVEVVSSSVVPQAVASPSLASPAAASPTVASPSLASPPVVDATPVPHEPAPAPGGATHDAIREGRRALRRGDYVAAEEAFVGVLLLRPRSAAATAGLADVNFEQGKHAAALRYAQRAARYEPRVSAHRLRLGDSYYRLGRYDEARVQYLVADRMGAAAAGARLDALARGRR